MWLSSEQVADLTGKKRVSSQVAVLVAASIPFKMVGGKPIVMVSSLEAVPESTPRPQVKRL